MFQKLKKDIKKSSERYENNWKIEIHPMTGEVYIRPKWFKYWCIFMDLLVTKTLGYCNIPYLFVFKPFKKGFLLYPEYLVYEDDRIRRSISAKSN
jgi:hypothetical protein